MLWFPFICLGIGALTGLLKLPRRVSESVECVGNAALVILMFTIGVNIGANDVVLHSAGIIVLQCMVISLFAVFFSICFVVLLEKTLLPLNQLRDKMIDGQVGVQAGITLETGEKKSQLVWVIPVCIIAGVLIGCFFILPDILPAVDCVFLTALAILYVSVGIGLAQNKETFLYIKRLGSKIILLPAAILSGSLLGGAAAAFLLNIQPHISVLAAGGMSYYSVTGAFMTQTYGIQAGTYGFLVNVFREFFTVMLLPLLIKISKGAPIAGGAAGNMDTMLLPVSRFVGIELGFVALITGTILTFTVPVLLPVLARILA